MHNGPIHLIVDSTGLKISGAGGWHAHRHKSSKARRQWRKLHVGVDDDGFIVAAKLTRSSEDDPSAVPDLLEQVDSPIKRFTADGAYDTRSVYELLGEVGDSLRTRDYESQKREARIACNVLNRMAELGKPESQAIVGE